MTRNTDLVLIREKKRRKKGLEKRLLSEGDVARGAVFTIHFHAWLT